MILTVTLPREPATLMLTIHRPDKIRHRIYLAGLERDGLTFSYNYPPIVKGLHRYTFQATMPDIIEAGDFTVEHVDLPQPKTVSRPDAGVTRR